MPQPPSVAQRQLGRTGFQVSPIGFGAFKIGRNQKTKYPCSYELPDEAEVARLLNGLLDLGINYIDTAPAYGLSEARIGRAVGHRRGEIVLSTKVGESFAHGVSTYDFSASAVRLSVHRSLERLHSDVLDIVFVHSPGEDLAVQQETDVISTLVRLKEEGLIRAIGFSGKTVAGTRRSLDWADVVMVEYHLDDRSHADVICEAAAKEIGIVVKKGLASGSLPAQDAIRFVLSNNQVGSLVVGGLNLDHMRANLVAAAELSRDSAA